MALTRRPPFVSTAVRGARAKMGDRTSVSSLLCFGLFVMACTALVEAEHKGAQELNCTFTAGTTVSISIVNNCGSSAKVRTCSAKFQQCVGYPTSPNHFQDCHQRIANGTTVDLVLDTEVSSSATSAIPRCAIHTSAAHSGAVRLTTVSPLH